MSLNTIVLLQIITSSFLTLWYRQTGIVLKNRTLQISFFVYIWVALSGTLIALAANNFAFPGLPSKDAWLFIVIEGLFIPAYWIIQFKLISLLGASNAVITQTLNYWVAAAFGLLILGEGLTKNSVAGLLLIVAAVYLSLSTDYKASRNQLKGININYLKIMLVVAAALFFAIGMTAEKLALGKVEVWDYALYGWSAQFIGAAIFYFAFGRKRKIAINRKFMLYSTTAGLLTALSGAFFIAALSTGMLSKTIILASSKIVLTSVLAIYFFKENNDLIRRFIALILALLGLLVIFLG